MIVPLSQPQRIDRKRFRALFCTPTILRPPPPILLYIRGRLKYNISFRKTLPWQLLPPALATLLQTLCCKIFVLKYSCRSSTLQHENFFNENFLIYGSTRLHYDHYVCISRLLPPYLQSQKLGWPIMPFFPSLS